MKARSSLASLLGTLLFLALLIAVGLDRHWTLALPVVGFLRFGKWLALGVYCAVPIVAIGAVITSRIRATVPGLSTTLSLSLSWAAGWMAIILIGIVTLATDLYSSTLWHILAVLCWTGIVIWLSINRWSPVLTLYRGLSFDSSTTPPLLSWNSLLAALGGLCALHASLPPDTRDELAYHLVLPRLWDLQGTWWVPNDNFHLLFPANTELIWGWAAAVSGPLAPRFVTLVFAALTLAMMWQWMDSKVIPRWTRAASIVFLVVTPMALTSAAICYVEWPMIFFLVLGWRLSRSEAILRSNLKLIAPASVWSVAMGMKYTAVLLAGLLAVEWLGRIVRIRPKRAIAASIALVVASTLLAAPWYVRNWQATGDPVYPLGGLIGTGSAQDDSRILVDYVEVEGLSRWLPWFHHATTDPTADHRLHPLWIVVHIAVLGLGWRWRRELPWWTVVGATAAFLPFHPAPRIYLPVLVLETMFLPRLVNPLAGHRWTRPLVTATLLTTTLVSVPIAAYELLVTGGSATPGYLIGLSDQDTFLRDRGLVTPVVAGVAASTPSDARVWTWCEDRVLYFDRWSRSDSPYGPPAFLSAMDSNGQSALSSSAAAVDYVVVRRDRCPEDWRRAALEKRVWAIDPETRSDLTAWVNENLREVARDDRYTLYKTLIRPNPS
jgi:hypothetical protein